MSDSSGTRSDVEVLAAEYLERRAAGETVRVEDYLRQHPDIADQIQDVFPALEALDSLSSDWKRNVARKKNFGLELPMQLGDYTLEKEIGRGGMGVVYEAHNAQLQRRVAIKLLASQTLASEKDVKRFQREAKAAAALHHTNIVPVFNFGEKQGHHFIAMQLIHGVGLDGIIEELQQTDFAADAVPATASRLNVPEYASDEYWNFVAELGRQVADALDYAHSQGTIHRDIKPANLLLDETGNLWVADFGLAAQSDSATFTRNNGLAGTLRYLSPEHFQGTCSERTDQFGLGVTLYELLTLRSITGDSETQAEIMRSIADSRFAKPRSINPAIPRDLENIISKSISGEPSARYADCRAMAEDLNRFLRGQTVQARRTSYVERLWRWARRNPGLAGSLTVSMVSLLMVAILALAAFSSERNALHKEREITSDVRTALDSVFDRYADSDVSDQATGGETNASVVLTPDTVETMEELLSLYDRIVDHRTSDGESAMWTLAARKRAGDVLRRLGRFEESVEQYKLALGYGQRPADEGSSNLALTIAAIHNGIGTCEQMLGQTESGQQHHEYALQTIAGLPMETDESKFLLARTHYLLAHRLRAGEGLKSERSIRPQTQERGMGGSRNAEGRRPRRGMRPPPMERPEMDRAEVLTPERKTHLKAAIQILQEGCEDARGPSHYRHLLATCLKMEAGEQIFKSATQQASETRSLLILARLHEEFPNSAGFAHSLMETLAGVNTRRIPPVSDRELRSIQERLEDAIRLGSNLIVQHPYIPEYKVSLVHCHNKLGSTLRRIAEIVPGHERPTLINMAIESLDEAVQLQTILVQQYPEAATYREWLKIFKATREDLTRSR